MNGYGKGLLVVGCALCWVVLFIVMSFQAKPVSKLSPGYQAVAIK
jgi:hypothetical protein